MLRVSRPSDEVVLNCWVTETKLTDRWSNRFHQPREIEKRPAQPIHLRYDDAVYVVGFDIFEQWGLGNGMRPIRREAV
jgi:hypothetical protein